MEFKDLVKDVKVLRALEENGIVKATEIQEKAIPVGIEGKDIIAKSQTGTGKTLAFVLPILDKLDGSKDLQALIVCPTRELSVQVFNEINKYIKYVDDVNVSVVYGGQRIDEQIRSLRKRPQIVVGTPGRLIDHLKRKTIKTNLVKTVVLDEADEMISIGFKEELETILEFLPTQRQTLFFSATFPNKVVDLSKKYLTNPVVIEQKVDNQTVSAIEQYFMEIKDGDKFEVLKRLILKNNELSIVFCNTKRRVDETVAQLQKSGIIAEAIHGDLSQNMRDNVMKKLRSGILDVLVATDVAARGIDVKGVGVVYNMDFPDDFEYYVHRIGRTGRAGKEGKSYTLITKRQRHRLNELMRVTKSDITQVSVPKIEEVNVERITKYLASLSFDAKEDATIVQPLLDAGITYEQIVFALLEKQFPISDFTTLVESRGRDDRNDRGRDRDRGRGRDRDRGNDRGRERKDGRRSQSRDRGDSVRLFINAGKSDNVRIKHIIGAFGKEAGIRENDINDVELMKDFSFVTIPAKDLDKALKVNNINDIKVRIETSSKKKN